MEFPTPSFATVVLGGPECTRVVLNGIMGIGGSSSEATADWEAEDETLAMVMDELGLEVAGTMSAVPKTQVAAAARSQSQPAAAQLGVADFS